MRAAVTGSGGFIGHHLVKALKAEGHWVRGVDIKPPEFEPTAADDCVLVDLRNRDLALRATRDVDVVFALAADMGGMGYIDGHDAEILHDNLLIDINTLAAARRNGVRKVVYTSSACVYPCSRQDTFIMHQGLAESDVWPADPQHGYGWAKLTAEKLFTAWQQAGLMDVRIARLHAIYGPLGTWQGGREKAPAALCRKVAEAPDGGSIEVWGDGYQVRSFCWIDDCVEGLLRLERSDYTKPLNIGTSELVSINQVADQIIALSGKNLTKRYVPGPQGVRGRNSNNDLCRRVLGWEPSTSLAEGLAATYAWVAAQVDAQGTRRREQEELSQVRLKWCSDEPLVLATEGK